MPNSLVVVDCDGHFVRHSLAATRYDNGTDCSD